jgi:hypothetical protein
MGGEQRSGSEHDVPEGSLWLGTEVGAWASSQWGRARTEARNQGWGCPAEALRFPNLDHKRSRKRPGQPALAARAASEY